jgi:hypothetical protein
MRNNKNEFDKDEKRIFILLYYFVMHYSDAVFLHLQFYCCRDRDKRVSMWNNKNEFDKDEKNIYFTLLFFNASLRYCIPLFPI